MLETIDSVQFRQQLAGLIAPSSNNFSAESFRETAAEVCFAMAHVFNRDVLEPKTLWAKIASAISVACERTDDGDMGAWWQIALEQIKAEPSKVAASEIVGELIARTTESEPGWRVSFTRYLVTHQYAAIIHGRNMWETRKEVKNESL